MRHRGRWPRLKATMHLRVTAIALAACAALGTAVQADQPAPVPGGAPVVTIKSTTGTVFIAGGEAAVRLGPAAQNVSFNRFVVSGALRRVQIPPTMHRSRVLGRWQTVRLPARQYMLPAALDGRQGFSISNPGGDVNVNVPRRVGALFVNAGSSNVVLSDVRGPYVIVASGAATVQLRNVVGHGFVRTLFGDIDLSGVGGNVRIETAAGNVTAEPSLAERAEVITGRGDITWTFGRLGAGEYRLQSASGQIRVSLRPDAGANVDAQSDAASVTNYLDPSAAVVRFSSPHALSLTVAGGGPEINLHSNNGAVTIFPVQGK
jgi:hypothetical protein